MNYAWAENRELLTEVAFTARIAHRGSHDVAFLGTFPQVLAGRGLQFLAHHFFNFSRSKTQNSLRTATERRERRAVAGQKPGRFPERIVIVIVESAATC